MCQNNKLIKEYKKTIDIVKFIDYYYLWVAAIGGIAGAISAQGVDNGKVFQIRGFTYQGSYDQ